MRRADRTRQREGARLVWYGKTPDEAHWHDHWAKTLTSERPRGIPDSDELLGVLRDWLPSDGPQLEAGCGAGDYVAALSKSGLPVEGVELSPDLVRLVLEHLSLIHI